MSEDSVYSDEQIRQEMTAGRHQHNTYVRLALQQGGPDSDEYRRAVRSAESEERFLNVMSECMALRDARCKPVVEQPVVEQPASRRRWWQRGQR